MKLIAKLNFLFKTKKNRNNNFYNKIKYFNLK